MKKIHNTWLGAVGALMAFILAGQAAAETPAQMDANKKLVANYIHEVFDAQDVSKVKDFLDEGYIQHNPNIPTGRVGFIEMFSKFFPKPLPAADIKLSQFDLMLAEGDLVQVTMKVARPDPKAPGKTYDSYWFDLYRLKDGKIIEHWDSALRTSPGMSPRN